MSNDFGTESLHQFEPTGFFDECLGCVTSMWPDKGSEPVENTSTQISIGFEVPHLPNGVKPKTPPLVRDVERLWFTRIRDTDFSPPDSGADSDENCGPVDVDESYRLQLRELVITPVLADTLLPSADFMNLAIRMYFTHFHPILPILHCPTFRPCLDNWLLLLQVVSIGCLFLGSTPAARQGRQIGETLHKLVLTSWESMIVKDNKEPIAMLQASVLGQTYWLLSGHAKGLLQFEVFHGSVIAIARRLKLLGQRHCAPELQDLPDEDLNGTWRKWARVEELSRAVAVLWIHDAELCSLLHLDPLLHHQTYTVPEPSSIGLFSSPTASHWASTLKAEAVESESATPTDRPEEKKLFSLYMALERLAVVILQNRRPWPISKTDLQFHHDSLLGWRAAYDVEVANTGSDKFCLVALWHWVYMTLLVDLNQLERFIGRDGQEDMDSALGYVQSWISSAHSTRCVLHAVLALRQLQALPLGTVPAIHVPRVLFSAAIVCHCYLQCQSDQISALRRLREAAACFPEATTLSAFEQRQLSDLIDLVSSCGTSPDLRTITLCEIGGCLQKMKHWGIAAQFAEIVTCLVFPEIKANREEDAVMRLTI